MKIRHAHMQPEPTLGDLNGGDTFRFPNSSTLYIKLAAVTSYMSPDNGCTYTGMIASPVVLVPTELVRYDRGPV